MVGSAQHAGLPCPEASAGTQLPALASGLVVQAPDLHTLRPHLQMRRDALAVWRPWLLAWKAVRHATHTF